VVKREVPAQQRVQQDTQRPHVRLVAHVPAASVRLRKA
jgi:hypothetical protein